MEDCYAEFEKKFDAEMFDMIDRCMVDMIKDCLFLTPKDVEKYQQYIMWHAETMKQKMAAYIDCKAKGFTEYIAEQVTIYARGGEEIEKNQSECS